MEDELMLWVDCETSGLDPKKHRVVELAMELTTWDLEGVDSLEAKFPLHPLHLERADPVALAINRYDHEEWKRDGIQTGMEVKAFWNRAARLCERASVWAGQNPRFDVGFVNDAASGWLGQPLWGDTHRRLLDTTAYAFIASRALDIRDSNGKRTASLVPVYNALGGPTMPEHRAMADVKRAQYLYKLFKAGFEKILVPSQ